MPRWESKQHKLNAGLYQQMHATVTGPVCVHQGCSKAGNVNTTLYVSIVIWVGTGSGCQHRAAPSIVHAVRNCPCLPVYELDYM